jgi:hypothetical protein
VPSIRTKLAAFASAFAVAAFGIAGAAPAAGATIKLGVFNSGAPASATTVANYTAEVGRRPDIVLWYTDFGGNLLTSEEMSTLTETGQAPMVTWEPHNQSLSAIAGGSYDSYLRSTARKAREWPGELMVRFAHEMNGPWYPWSGSPTTYVAAWRHIVTIFREEGATNVKWVWAPNVDRNGAMPFSEYFPGESWVDYLGLDGYNWGNTPGNSWNSLKEVFAASYAKITSLSQKPLFITETASSETGGSKAEWIRTGFMQTIPQEFPRVTGVIWFNETKEDDWRINSSQASLGAYRAVVNCSIYGGTGPCEGATERKRLIVRSVHVTPRFGNAVTGSVSYDLSESAQVQIKILPLGHFAHTVSIVRTSRTGHNRVPLSRILHRRHLHAGRYRVVVIARNRSDRSRRHRVHFRVV